MEILKTSVTIGSAVHPTAITILIDNLRRDAIVSFSYLDMQYDFTVEEWNRKNIAAFSYEYDVYHNQTAKVRVGDAVSELICAGARDIVTAIFGVLFLRGVTVLNYATYHLKHFRENEISYDSTIMRLACRAIVDTNFFASPVVRYERITLAHACDITIKE